MLIGGLCAGVMCQIAVAVMQDYREPDAGVLRESTAVDWMLVYTTRPVPACEMNICIGGGRGD